MRTAGDAGGMRVSELVALTWADLLDRQQGRLQLSITGKGGKVRNVLLPEIVSRSLLSLRGDAAANDPVFVRKASAYMSVPYIA
jgi:integrase/recombinase XerD